MASSIFRLAPLLTTQLSPIWSSAGRFLRSYYGLDGGRYGASNPPRPDGSVESAKAVLGYFREIASEK